MRVVYQFNIRTFVRAILQYTNIDRDPTLYEDEVDAQTRELGTQLLFSYKLNPQTVVDRLKPLATPGNPWFGSAGELVAMAYMKQGKEELAGPLFAAIAKDDDVPQTLRSRARQLAGLLGYDAVEDVDRTLAEMREEGDTSGAPVAAPAQ